MTPIILLDDLQKFIKENTADILLEVKVRTGTATEKERAAKVYKMGLPEKDDSTQQIPYILLKVLTGKTGKRICSQSQAKSGAYVSSRIFTRRRAGTAGVIKPYFTDTGAFAEATHNRRAFLP